MWTVYHNKGYQTSWNFFLVKDVFVGIYPWPFRSTTSVLAQIQSAASPGRPEAASQLHFRDASWWSAETRWSRCQSKYVCQEGPSFVGKMLSYLNSSVPDLVKFLLTFERIPRHSKKHIAFPETVKKKPKVSDIPTSMSKPEVWISWIFIANRWKISNDLQCLPTLRLIQSCGISCHFNRRKFQWKDLSLVTSTWVGPDIGCPKIQLIKTLSYPLKCTEKCDFRDIAVYPM